MNVLVYNIIIVTIMLNECISVKYNYSNNNAE